MHGSSLLRMNWFANTYLDLAPNYKVLDVGSYDVNGTYKPIFSKPKFEYTGLDMLPGPNVDIVMLNPYNWSSIETDSYDVVISGQAFEHIEFFWVIMSEMVRVLKKDGILCCIAPLGFSEHRYPVDCYRFFTDGMVALARYTNLEILHAHTNAAPTRNYSAWYSDTCADSMLVATKPYSGNTLLPDFNTYVCTPPDQNKLLGNMIK